MSRITAGNRLYLYSLFKREIGVGKQERVSRFEEVLAADDILPEDMECADANELMQELDGIIKLTVFKKGRTYATLLENDEYEKCLSAVEQDGSQKKASQGGKSWKHKKTSKMPKPAKPRHKRPKKAAPKPEPEAAPAEAPTEAPAAPSAEAAPSTAEPQPHAQPSLAEQIAAIEAETKASEEPEAVAEAPKAAHEEPVRPAEKAAENARDTEPEATAAAPQAANEPEPKPEPEPRKAPEPEHPSISLRITYVPEDEPEDATAESAGTEPAQEAPTASPACQAKAEPTGSAPAGVLSAQSDLPQTISLDVHVKDELLRELYQMLPIDADVMATLDEDWRVARSTALLTGTRSRVTFPLRYLHESDGTPVQVTLKRSAKHGMGKRWSLAYVDGDDGTGTTHEPVGMEGLPTADEGAWSELSGPTHATTTSPIREFAQFAVIGSWETYLGTLATMAEPERWDYPGEGVGRASRYGILREYLSLTFHRARQTGRLATSADGSLAAFDTGLATPFSQDIYACFRPNRGAIEWRSAGFCVAGSGELGGELVAKFDPLPAPVEYLSGLEDVAVDPSRLVVLDTDSIISHRLGVLPRAFLEDELEGSPDASRLLQDALSAAGDRRARQDALDGLSRAIKGDPGLYRRLGRSLEEALGVSLGRARRSYRVVAPAYDPTTDGIRLLLPLCLVDEARADCAVVLTLLPSGNYQGTTIMSLDRARACTRTVSAEAPVWLAAGANGDEL